MENMEKDNLNISQSKDNISELDSSAVCFESGVDPANVYSSKSDKKDEDKKDEDKKDEDKSKEKENEEKKDGTDTSKSELVEDGNIGQNGENKKSIKSGSNETDGSGKDKDSKPVVDNVLRSDTSLTIESSEIKYLEAGKQKEKEKEKDKEKEEKEKEKEKEKQKKEKEKEKEKKEKEKEKEKKEKEKEKKEKEKEKKEKEKKEKEKNEKEKEKKEKEKEKEGDKIREDKDEGEKKETESKGEEDEKKKKKLEKSGKGEKMEEVSIDGGNVKEGNTVSEPVTDKVTDTISASSPLAKSVSVDFATLEDAPRLEKPISSIKEMEESNLDPKFSEIQTGASGIEKKEHLYKILVIGELGTGKTSIIKRYVHQFFSQHYRATIGVDFALKVISWDTDTLIRLQLWDIAGQERFGNMTRVYYKEAVGAFVVFDVTRVPTFEAVVKWKNDLDSKVQLSDGSNIPCVLLANKCDQTKEGLVNNSEQMDEFCKEKGFLNWFETSAKENINIDEAARFLVGQILKNDQNLNTGSTEDDPERIQLANANQDGGTKKSCCR